VIGHLPAGPVRRSTRRSTVEGELEYGRLVGYWSCVEGVRLLPF
jgi:hypothetical protein